MKKLFLLLPALAIMTAAHAGGDSSEKQAMNMLKKFYKSYIAEMSKSAPDENVLTALIEKNTTENFREMWETNAPDCDVFLWKQDYDKKWAKTLKVQLSDDYSWMYKVTFKADGSEIPMWVDVVNGEGVWQIDNIDNLHLGSSDDDHSTWEEGYTDTDEFEFLEYNNEGGGARLFVLAPYDYTTAMDLVSQLDYVPELCRGDMITVRWEAGEVNENEDGEKDYTIYAKEIEGLKYGPVTKFRRTKHAEIEYSLRGGWTENEKAKYAAAVEYLLARGDEKIMEILAGSGDRLCVIVDETTGPSDVADDWYEENGEEDAEHPGVWLSVGIQSGGRDIIPAGGIVIEYGEYGKATYYRMRERSPRYYEEIGF